MLTDARVLITGASSGIGAALAEVFTERMARGPDADRARLVLCGADPDRLASVAEATGAVALLADLTDPEQLAKVAAACAEVDVLVHCAGRGWAGAVEQTPVAELVAVNLAAPIQLTAAALPGMRARGGGSLVFIASIAAVGVRDEAVYAATKAGLRTFAASVRYEAETHRIGVTTVLPGAVATPFFDRRGRAYERRFPRPVSARLVAERTVRAVQTGRAEVFVPRWLSVPARVSGALPATFHRLAGRFG